MIIAKVRKSGKYDAEKYAKKIATDFHNKSHLNIVVRETPCHYFVETARSK